MDKIKSDKIKKIPSFEWGLNVFIGIGCIIIGIRSIERKYLSFPKKLFETSSLTLIGIDAIVVGKIIICIGIIILVLYYLKFHKIINNGLIYCKKCLFIILYIGLYIFMHFNIILNLFNYHFWNSLLLLIILPLMINFNASLNSCIYKKGKSKKKLV